MKATKQPNGTIDLIGLSLRQAQFLLPTLSIEGDGHPSRDVFSSTEFNQLYALAYPAPKRSNSEPLRDSTGRFLKKKWVARFKYLGTKDWAAERREVITELSGKGKKRPSSVPLDYIKGYDTERNAFRQFKVDSIEGKVEWSREYPTNL